MYYVEDLRLRPSYEKLYHECKASPEEFKLRSYENTYLVSLRSSIQVFTFNAQTINQFVATKGIPQQLDFFLQNETTPLALTDCFRSEKAQLDFVRNLLVVDAMGKFAGIAVGVSGFKLWGLVFEKIGVGLAYISPALATYSKVAFALVSSYFAYMQFHEFAQVQNENLNQNPNSRGASTPNSLSRAEESEIKLSQTAASQLQMIKKLLQDPMLSAEQRSRLQVELSNWEIIAKNFQ